MYCFIATFRPLNWTINSLFFTTHLRTIYSLLMRWVTHIGNIISAGTQTSFNHSKRLTIASLHHIYIEAPKNITIKSVNYLLIPSYCNGEKDFWSFCAPLIRTSTGCWLECHFIGLRAVSLLECWWHERHVLLMGANINFILGTKYNVNICNTKIANNIIYNIPSLLTFLLGSRLPPSVPKNQKTMRPMSRASVFKLSTLMFCADAA